MSKSSILIVEDEALIAANIVQSLSSLGYTVFEPVATGDEAIQAVLAEKPDLVLMDIELYGPINGIETAKKIRAIANIPVVYLTAYTDEMLLKEARLTEPYGYIVKPSHNRELHATIEMALYKHALDSKLRESEEKYRTLLETLNEGVWVIDNEAVTTFVNPKMAEILGYTVDEMTGRSLFSFMDDEGRRICEWNIERRQQGIKEQHDFEFLKKDETRIYASLEATPLLGKDGQYLGAIAGVVDITERRLSENMLRDLSTYNRGLIEASLDPLVTISREGKIQDVNSSTETITGFDRNELIGTDFHEYFTEPERAREGYQRVFSEGKVINYPLEIRHHDGHTAPVLYNATVYYDNEGEIKGVFAAARDITESKRAEEALQQANRKLKLLSGITRHDINNQLSVLLGNLRVSFKKQQELAQNEYLQKVLTAANRISSMIRFTKEYEEIGVQAPAWQAIKDLVDAAEHDVALGQTVLINDLPGGVEVFADQLLAKVFYNLLDNAVRYGGTITRVRFAIQEYGGDYLIVCEDYGEGIPAEEKERIFERGFGKNTGLGLALSREILAITGITIRENGEPGKGARFEMRVPKGMWRTGGK